MDDWSDLTSLSSESEEEYRAPQKKKKKGKNKPEYYITNALRAPRTTQYSAKSLYDSIVIEAAIDLDPEYQREVVWPESKQSGLIDSILRNYYIPPVIFAVTQDRDGSERRVCIDGKQRLTSIQRFFDGMIPHKDSADGSKRWYKQHPGKPARQLLPKQYIQQFANKQITCVEYDNLNGDQEREIFQRVQMGMALTPAERLQALTGPWPTLVRDLLHHVRLPSPDGVSSMLKFASERGRDFQCIGLMAAIVEKWPDVAKSPGTGTVEKLLERKDEPTAQFREEAMDTFSIFATLVADRKYNSTFKKKVSPVEFTMISVLIFAQRSKLSLKQLSSAIKNMRIDVWEKYKDNVRQNQRVLTHMVNFIKELKASSLTGDGLGDTPAALRATKKRKRVAAKEESDSETEDEKPLARASSSKARVSKVQKQASTAKSKLSKTSSSTRAEPAVPKSRSRKKVIESSSSPPSDSGPSKPKASQPTPKPRKSTQSNGAPMPPKATLTASSSLSTSVSASAPTSPAITGQEPAFRSTPPAAAPASVSAPPTANIPSQRAPIQIAMRMKRDPSLPSPSLTPDRQTVSQPVPPHPEQADRLAPLRAARQAAAAAGLSARGAPPLAASSPPTPQAAPSPHISQQSSTGPPPDPRLARRPSAMLPPKPPPSQPAAMRTFVKQEPASDADMEARLKAVVASFGPPPQTGGQASYQQPPPQVYGQQQYAIPIPHPISGYPMAPHSAPPNQVSWGAAQVQIPSDRSHPAPHPHSPNGPHSPATGRRYSYDRSPERPREREPSWDRGRERGYDSRQRRYTDDYGRERERDGGQYDGRYSRDDRGWARR